MTSTHDMVQTLLRRRGHGISYACTDAAFADVFAPVVARLTGTRGRGSARIGECEPSGVTKS